MEVQSALPIFCKQCGQWFNRVYEKFFSESGLCPVCNLTARDETEVKDAL